MVIPEPISPAARTLADLIRSASSARKPIALQGGGTHSLLSAGRETVSLAQLDKIIEYAPEDLTITVEAGVPFAALQQVLAQKKQWLPIEPPHNEKSTIGGIVATNAVGLSRFRYESIRNWLIGARFVTANGDIVHSGSKVVKSVAGYDLHKMLIGSYGTIAAITELTFKIAPMQEQRLVCAINMGSSSNEIIQIASSSVSLEPTFLAYCNSGASFHLFGENVPRLIIGFDGFAEDIVSRKNELQKQFSKQHVTYLSDGDNIVKTMQAINNYTFAKQGALRIISDRTYIINLIQQLDSLPVIFDLANGTADTVVNQENVKYVSDIILNSRLGIIRAKYLWQRDKDPAPGSVPQAEKNLVNQFKQIFDPHNIFGSLACYD